MMTKYELDHGDPSLPKISRIKKTGCPAMTTAKLIILCLLLISLSAAVVVLATLLSSRDQTIAQNKALFNQSGGNDKKEKSLCLTRTCIETANRINQAVDPSISPCDNFYQFACGGWEKKTHMPYYSSYGWSVLDELGLKSNVFFKEQLEAKTASNFEPDVKARDLYMSCMDTSAVDANGLTEAREIIDEFQGISDNTSVSKEEYDLTQRMIDMASLGSYPLIKLKGEFHRYDLNTILLQISPPESPIIFSKSDNLQLWQMMASEYLKPWADLYKGSRAPSIEAFLEVYNLMNDLKETLDRLGKDFRSNWNDTIIPVANLSTYTPSINWTYLISHIFPDEKISTVKVSNKQYLIFLEYLITKHWSIRALDNYMKFRFVLDNIPYFPYEYRKVQDNLINRIVFDNPTWQPAPRWHFCVEQIKELMPLVLARWYIEDYIEKEDAVVYDVYEMIEHIRGTYVKILSQTNLLDPQTAQIAIEKIKAMDDQIGFPKSLKNLTLISSIYGEVVARKNNSFFRNVIETNMAYKFRELQIIGVMSAEQKKEIWLDHTFVTNGYYSSNLNRLTILAGILQGEFYNYENPKYMNYGSMGFTIGHEFTHGFDDTGRHFGANGLLHDWWTNTSEMNYEKVKQCYIEQYNFLSIVAYDTNATYSTNGNQTLDENIADNGAEYVVFQAYQQWVNENGEEPLLPTPHISDWKQLYYVAQAQGWCAKYKTAGLAIMLDTSEHSQKEARVNGMYQNSARFADIFNCPVGSYMNPSNKCKLW